ncbi:MetQ/NlpA family ABC transporter substrate-binding protein [Intestinibacter sp.]
MKLKKLAKVLLVTTLAVGLLTGCSSGGSDDKTIKVGASPTPHAEILEAAKPILEEKGYTLKISTYDDYVLPNDALNDGSLDANYFQHIPYLEETVKEKGYDLTYSAKVHIEPMGIYSNSLKSLDDIKDGAKVAVPNDSTNEARALQLLAKNGLIEVKEGELVTAKDITSNPKNLKFVEVDAAQVPSTLDDVQIAVINTNYALNVGLNPTKDALAIESSDSPYVNIVAIRSEDKDSEKIKALTEALNSDEVKKFIEEKYNGSIVPAF